MKIMCIWTKGKEDNFMKIARSKSEINNAVVAGRKPDKIIARASEIKPLTKKDLKKYIAYDGQIILDTSVIYDGKHGLK